MAALGKNGFRQVAEACVQKAHYAAEKLCAIPGVRLKYTDPFAFEFTLELPKDAGQVRDDLLSNGILAGLPLGEYYSGMSDCLLTAVTEVRTKQQIDDLVESMASAVA
jgi:glycine dehydrogenase subunit 1